MSKKNAVDFINSVNSENSENSENIKILDDSLSSYYDSYKDLFNANEIRMSSLYQFFETYYNFYKPKGEGIFFKTINNYDEDVISATNKDESSVALFDFFIFKRLYGGLTIIDDIENSLSDILSFANKRKINKKFYRNILDNLNLKIDIVADPYPEIPDTVMSIADTLLVKPFKLLYEPFRTSKQPNVFFLFYENIADDLIGDGYDYYNLLNLTKHFTNKDDINTINELENNLIAGLKNNLITGLKKSLSGKFKNNLVSELKNKLVNELKTTIEDEYNSIDKQTNFLQKMIEKVLTKNYFCEDILKVYKEKYGECEPTKNLKGLNYLYLLIGLEIFLYDMDMNNDGFLFLLNKTYYDYIQSKISVLSNEKTLRQTVADIEIKMYKEMNVSFKINGMFEKLEKVYGSLEDKNNKIITCERFHLIIFFCVYTSLFSYIKNTYENIELIEDEKYRKQVKNNINLIKEYLPEKFKKEMVAETYIEEILKKHSKDKINELIAMFTYIVMKNWNLKLLDVDTNEKTQTVFFLKIFSVGFNYAMYSPINLFEDLNFDTEFKQMEIMARDIRGFIGVNFQEFVKEVIGMVLYKSWNGIAPIGIIELIKAIKVIPDELKDGLYLEFNKLDWNFNSKVKIWEAMTSAFLMEVLNWVKSTLLTMNIVGTTINEMYISLYTLREIFKRIKDSEDLKEALQKSVNSIRSTPMFIDYKNKGYGLFSLDKRFSIKYNKSTTDKEAKISTYLGMNFDNDYTDGLIKYIEEKLSGLITYESVLEENLALVGTSLELEEVDLNDKFDTNSKIGSNETISLFKESIKPFNFFTLENYNKRTFVLVNYLQRKYNSIEDTQGAIISNVSLLKKMMNEMKTEEAQILIYYTQMNLTSLFGGYSYPEIRALNTFNKKETMLDQMSKVANFFENSNSQELIKEYYKCWNNGLNKYETIISEVDHYLYNYVSEKIGNNKLYDYFVKFFSTFEIACMPNAKPSKLLYKTTDSIINFLDEILQWFYDQVAEFEINLSGLYDIYMEKFRILQEYQGIKSFSEFLQKLINSLNDIYNNFNKFFEFCSI